MWIGGTDTQTEDTWVVAHVGGGHTAMDYTHWAPGQPDGGTQENCIEMWTTGEWNDAPCGDVKGYACMVPMPPADLTFETACWCVPVSGWLTSVVVHAGKSDDMSTSKVLVRSVDAHSDNLWLWYTIAGVDRYQPGIL